MKERLLACIQSRMPFAAKPAMDSDLFDELGFDSGLLLDLILAIEDEFDCRFDEDQLSIDALRSPTKILALIEAAGKARPASADPE